MLNCNHFILGMGTGLFKEDFSIVNNHTASVRDSIDIMECLNLLWTCLKIHLIIITPYSNMFVVITTLSACPISQLCSMNVDHRQEASRY